MKISLYLDYKFILHDICTGKNNPITLKTMFNIVEDRF